MVATTPSPIIQLRAVSKQFKQQQAVDSLDLEIQAGLCFGFLGPNGAGKTTTLRMLMGLTPVSSGSISVFGIPVDRNAGAVRARVGIVPQANNLDPDFSVEENLYIYASYFGQKRAVTQARIDALLEFVALQDRRTAKTDTLSGGMQRRLVIARALINEPEMVVLDEPTTGLDPQARHVIWARLAELKAQGKTLLLTTHYMEEAERLCDELVIMDQGRVLDQGSPRQLIERHVEPEVIELRGEQAERALHIVNEEDCRLERMGTSVYCYVYEPAHLLTRLRNEHNLTLIHRPSGLEDVFLRLTGRELRD